MKSAPDRLPLLAGAVAMAVIVHQRPAAAATIDWSGRTWEVTAGGMAGVCEGSASNVSIDVDGYLHLNRRGPSARRRSRRTALRAREASITPK